MKNRYSWYRAFKRVRHHVHFNLQQIHNIAKFTIDFYDIDTSNLKNIRIKETLRWLVWSSIFYKFCDSDAESLKEMFL